jgi:hypothetical protein
MDPLAIPARRQVRHRAQGSRAMIWTILAVLVVLWLLGLLANIGGGLIHLLLVLAVIVFIANMLSGRRTV